MPKNAYKPTSNDIFPGTGDAAVGQDKIGQAADRQASAPPVRGAQELRSEPGKSSSSQSGARVPVTAHVKPEVKAELARLARQGRKKGEWLSLSQTASALLEKGIQGTIALPWQFKGTFRGISVGYEFRIGKAKRRRYLWKRKNCQSSVRAGVEIGVVLEWEAVEVTDWILQFLCQSTRVIRAAGIRRRAWLCRLCGGANPHLSQESGASGL